MTELAEDDGTVVGTYAYDTFGPVRAHTGATTEWTYTGEQNDSDQLASVAQRGQQAIGYSRDDA